ncbi:PqqD family protein [Streptomyces sp. NPDC093595]|uniref:PqqD family protein n=1 Tax=Streptomyces sp. NPDC093595 TaxID=3366045 RepID=UPI003828DC4D
MMTQRTGVHYSATPDGIAVLDVRRGRGRWRFLDPIGAELWTKITSGIPADTAIEGLTHTWIRRGADAARVRADLTALLDVLSASQLLGPV